MNDQNVKMLISNTESWKDQQFRGNDFVYPNEYYPISNRNEIWCMIIIEAILETVFSSINKQLNHLGDQRSRHNSLMHGK